MNFLCNLIKMNSQKIDIIKNYYNKVKNANKELTKKELFKDLLNRLYIGNNEIVRLIDAISAGAERTILNIPRKNKKHRGSADTLYNNIIIEFEKDLKVTYKHAKEQLAGYLLGEFKSGMGYNYTLIASDFIHWKVLVPDINQIDNLYHLQEHELNLIEVTASSFTLNEDNAEDFYFWIDRFLFKEEKQKATLKAIEEAFGYRSSVFIDSYNEISNVFFDAKKYGEVQVSYEQWKKFLSIAYGSFEDSSKAFIIHTYLSILAKVLAYEVISNDDFIDDNEMRGILNGNIFHHYNIKNFIDNDFFHWVHGERYFAPLKKAFRNIAQELAFFDFINTDEDILKGVYQELIDLDTRHALGEYYTPDWLCERIVQEYSFKNTDKILDPSCGSGSFLRAAIHNLKNKNKNITAEEINNCIYGIDIHPLSVQIAKTTLLVSLGKEITKAKKPIHLNIILANTLLAPEGVQNLFGGEFMLQIDKEKYFLNTQVFEDVRLFDEALELCEELAEQTQGKKAETIAAFNTILQNQYKNGGINKQISESFYKIYTGFKKVKEDGRDSIWKFIVQNLYKPYFLNRKFDYIIGNPPWFTYSSIKNEEYQDILNSLADKYDVKPLKAANFPHLEIAAIFLSYCSNYFLKEDGKLAFVLPRSFFSADHHDNTRSGKARGFNITDIWDLQDISPLFRIPSCVLFAKPNIANVNKGIPKAGIEGKNIAGRLPSHNCNWQEAELKVTENKVIWHYAKQGKASAYSVNKTKGIAQTNYYKKHFKQGATIVPRTFYFVELNQVAPPDFEDRILNIKTNPEILPDAKKPWKDINLADRIESQFLFRTALSKSILPFALLKPDLVVLPIIIEKDENDKKIITILSADELRKKGLLKASKWFTNCENIWNIHRTAKSEKLTSNDRLNYQRGLISQNLNAQYLVLYNASAKNANATIVDRAEIDLEFLVESTAYVYYTNNINEAYYLTAILNSKLPNLMMKDFQAKGLFGARHVHKKILDIYFPKFDEGNIKHTKLAELSEVCHLKTKEYLLENMPVSSLSAMQLGKLRTSIKKSLTTELNKIDTIVEKLIK